MNQINLEKLLQQAQSGKPDNGSVKLLVAQVYQAQVQQLTNGNLRLQLPQPGGALQLNLPASVTPQLQQLLASAVTAQPYQAAGNVKLQFQPLADGNIQLTIQNATAALTVPLSAPVLRQLLLAAYQQLLPAKASNEHNSAASTVIESQQPEQPAGPARQLPATQPLPQHSKGQNSPPGINIAAQLLRQPGGLTLQLPAMPPQTLQGSGLHQLSTLLPDGANRVTLQLLLQLPAQGEKLSAVLSLPQWPAATANNHNILNQAGQTAVLQQLVRLFNQQQLPAGITRALLPADVKLPAIPAGYQLQLSQPATAAALPQLQLVSPKTVLQLAVSPQQFNRPLHISQPPSGPLTDTTATTQTVLAQPFVQPLMQQPAAQPTVLQQAALQQAWRQLLPLLPAVPAPLAELPELPEPVQQLFRLVRHSQLDGSKVWTPAQLQPQLAAALAFQPLQNAAAIPSSSGTLAVAIQLLLGHLLQKPASPAQPAQALARLISQLEPAQASGALRQLASHSSTLQQSQLATLESSNSQQLLLQIPLQQGQQSQFCQLMLEQREADGKQAAEKRTLWQLTMRFDLKQHGAMMVVARLAEQQLKLQFYTEQPAARQLAERFLPVLKDRCAMQGIQVEQVECVLGKIPDSLLPRANSLLAIKV